jgi:hypothetical protein
MRKSLIYELYYIYFIQYRVLIRSHEGKRFPGIQIEASVDKKKFENTRTWANLLQDVQ